MKRQLITLSILALSLSACSEKVTPTAPSDDNSPRFVATLLAANEVPPVTNAESGATGTATITFNVTRDAAGTITAATANFSVSVAGVPAGTTLTAAHIHPGFTGINGSPLVNLALSAGEISFATGSGSFTKNGITVTADQAAAILATPAGFYFNIHTALNGGGVARGQLVRQ